MPRSQNVLRLGQNRSLGPTGPYTYPGTDTLRNRLGITDDKTLTEAERRLTQARGAEAARLTFPATADGYRALHKHLFQDLYEWAGQDRTVDTAKGGARFAHVPYIARELDKLFADVGAKNGLRGLKLMPLIVRLLLDHATGAPCAAREEKSDDL